MMRSRHLAFSQAFALLVGHVIGQNIYACPDNDGNSVVDQTTGTQYIMRCGYDTTPGGGPTSVYVTDSFNQCFNYCSTTDNCAAFTYSGSNLGVGSGTCYLKYTQVGAYSTFSGGGNSGLVSAIKLANYPPLPPSFTCPQAQDRTVVTDPNTGVQYALWCNYDTYSGSTWSIQVSDSFNDCFYQCSTSANMDNGNCTAFTYQPTNTGPLYGVGPGTCYMKTYTQAPSQRFVPPSGAYGNIYYVAAVKLQYYDGSNGAPFFYATTIATIFPPAATQFLIQTSYITQTFLQAFPFTIFSTVTRPITVISSLTRTVTNLLTLPDTTQILTSIQIIPTTIVSLQVTTITIISITTQQLVTVIPTTILQTVFSTANLIQTGTNTRTTVLQPIATITPPGQTVRPTVTVAIG